MRAFIKNVFQFYCHDCCWPYAVSFFLVLVIYWQDFFVVRTTYHGASLGAYGVILAYYLYILHAYSQSKGTTASKFFMAFLSGKVMLWGAALILLHYISS